MTALLGLATRLGLARLLLITGTRTEQADLPAFADACFAGGVDLMQLRDPSADHDQLLTALTAMRKVALHYQGLVAVYGSAPLAQEFGGGRAAPAPSAGSRPRRPGVTLHEWALVGRSCHSRGQVDAALADPNVNYLNVGPVFGGLTQDGGLDLVRHAAEVAPPRRRGLEAVVRCRRDHRRHARPVCSPRGPAGSRCRGRSPPPATRRPQRFRSRIACVTPGTRTPAMANLTLQVFRHHE